MTSEDRCGCEYFSHTPEREAALQRAALAMLARHMEPHRTPLLDRIWGTEPGRYVGDPRPRPPVAFDPVEVRLQLVAVNRRRDA